MKFKMNSIMKARQEILYWHQHHQEQRSLRLLPDQENFCLARNDAQVDYSQTLATVRFEDYGDLILEIPDAPASAVKELDKLKLQLKEIKQILTIVKLNPMHDRNIQVTRALRCLEILNGETE
jgi:hypothetical protein